MGLSAFFVVRKLQVRKRSQQNCDCKMSNSDVSSPEVGRDDGTGSSLRMAANYSSDTNLNVTTRPEVREESSGTQSKDFTLSLEDDDLVAAIKEASFIPTLEVVETEELLSHVEMEEPQINLSFSSAVHVSTPYPGREMAPPYRRPSLSNAPPTPFNSFSTDSDANISDLIVITSALEEEGHGLQIGQEIVLEVGQELNSGNTQETMTQREGVWADDLNPSDDAVTYKRKPSGFNSNRKDVCKGMSTEQVEKLSLDKKITEY